MARISMDISSEASSSNFTLCTPKPEWEADSPPVSVTSWREKLPGKPFLFKEAGRMLGAAKMKQPRMTLFPTKGTFTFWNFLRPWKLWALARDPEVWTGALQSDLQRVTGRGR